jgi:hypothetical protein
MTTTQNTSPTRPDTRTERATVAPLTSTEELQYGGDVTIGKSTLIWTVDCIEHGTIHLSCRYRRGGRPYSWFRNFSTAEALRVLNKITYTPEESA